MARTSTSTSSKQATVIDTTPPISTAERDILLARIEQRLRDCKRALWQLSDMVGTSNREDAAYKLPHDAILATRTLTDVYEVRLLQLQATKKAVIEAAKPPKKQAVKKPVKKQVVKQVVTKQAVKKAS